MTAWTSLDGKSQRRTIPGRIKGRINGRFVLDMTALAEWNNFYVIVGSSAGALIGLQFVAKTFDKPARVLSPPALFGRPADEYPLSSALRQNSATRSRMMPP